MESLNQNVGHGSLSGVPLHSFVGTSFKSSGLYSYYYMLGVFGNLLLLRASKCLYLDILILLI